MAGDNYYPNVDDPETGGDSAVDQTTAGDQTDQGGNESGLLPKTFFKGTPEVGDTCVIKVTAVHEDDVEVEYVKDLAKGADEGSSDQGLDQGTDQGPTMDSARVRIAAMAQ